MLHQTTQVTCCSKTVSRIVSSTSTAGEPTANTVAMSVQMYGFGDVPQPPPPDHFVDDGQVLTLAASRRAPCFYRVTRPGALTHGEHIFVGDTLFMGSVTGSPLGDTPTPIATKKLMQEDDALITHSGHVWTPPLARSDGATPLYGQLSAVAPGCSLELIDQRRAQPVHGVTEAELLSAIGAPAIELSVGGACAGVARPVATSMTSSTPPTGTGARNDVDDPLTTWPSEQPQHRTRLGARRTDRSSPPTGA